MGLYRDGGTTPAVAVNSSTNPAKLGARRLLTRTFDGGKDLAFRCCQDPREGAPDRRVRPPHADPAVNAVICGLRDRGLSPHVAAAQSGRQAQRGDRRMVWIAVEQGERVDVEDSRDLRNESRLRLLGPAFPMPDALLARCADPLRERAL
jgi:hypothetical protein